MMPRLVVALFLALSPFAARAQEPAPEPVKPAAVEAGKAAAAEAAEEPAGAKEEGEEAEGLEQELALDLGAEFGEATVPTAGLLYGVEVGRHAFVLTGALVREEGKVLFADATVGYYRSFEMGWLRPEIGAEVGAFNELEKRPGAEPARKLVPFERLGVGVVHDFSPRCFAGLVADAGFAGTTYAGARGLLEIGVKL